jgi:zinc D-Ala-D-Ala carboxypeptidase
VRSRRPRPALLVALVAVFASGCSGGAPVAPTPEPPAASVPAATARPAPRPAEPVVRGGPELMDRDVRARPAQPVLVARYEAAMVTDPCVDRALAAPPATDIVFTVLDRTYALPAAYVPDDLVPAAEAGVTGPSATKLVRAVLVDDLRAMREAWDAAGLTIAIDSAYRSYADQAATHAAWVDRIGREQADLRTARPGHSEHQLGTAIDVSSPGWSGRFGDWARETAEGAWMAEHAWRHGFVMSYPAGAEARTCFGYEPWHYRWIGREAAAEHRESGMTLREFLERYVGA